MTKHTRMPSTRPFKRAFGVFVSIIAFASISVTTLAQEQAAAVDPDAVVAIVGGEAITEADLAFAAEDLTQELGNVSPAERRSFLASVLIDMKVMARAARNENMQDSEVFRRRQRYLEDRALRRAYFAEKIGQQVTQEAVQAAYDEMVSGFEPREEVRARHILVADEGDANSIRAEIEAGKPFEIAASENSLDGSAQNGGDLGYFGAGQMVPPFEAAAFALEIGAVSAPVQSQFGWHLIKLEDRRQSAPPPLEQVGQQLQQQVLLKAFDDTIKALKEGVVIEVADPEMEAALNASEAN